MELAAQSGSMRSLVFITAAILVGLLDQANCGPLLEANISRIKRDVRVTEATGTAKPARIGERASQFRSLPSHAHRV